MPPPPPGGAIQFRRKLRDNVVHQDFWGLNLLYYSFNPFWLHQISLQGFIYLFIYWPCTVHVTMKATNVLALIYYNRIWMGLIYVFIFTVQNAFAHTLPTCAVL